MNVFSKYVIFVMPFETLVIAISNNSLNEFKLNFGLLCCSTTHCSTIPFAYCGVTNKYV